MTREEAIMHLDYLKDYKTPQQIDAINLAIDHIEAIDLAMKALRRINLNEELHSMIGEWKWESQDICANCGYEIPHLERVVGETVLMDSKDWDYCPHCGCKLKGLLNSLDEWWKGTEEWIK